MCEALGMSETAARNWFNGEEEIELSIEQLVSEIKEYVESKGKEFRELSHEPPLIRSKLFWNGSVFPDFAINCSNLAIFKSLP